MFETTNQICMYIYIDIYLCVPVQFYTLYIYKRFCTVSTHICTYSCMCFSLSLSIFLFFLIHLQDSKSSASEYHPNHLA